MERKEINEAELRRIAKKSKVTNQRKTGATVWKGFEDRRIMSRMSATK